MLCVSALATAGMLSGSGVDDETLATLAKQLSQALVKGLVPESLASTLATLFPRAAPLRLSLLSGDTLVSSSNLAEAGYSKLCMQPLNSTVAGHAISRRQWLHVGQAVQSRGFSLSDLDEMCIEFGCESMLSVPIFQRHNDERCNFAGDETAVGTISLGFKRAIDLDFGLLSKIQVLAGLLGQNLCTDVAPLLDSISMFLQPIPAHLSCVCGCASPATGARRLRQQDLGQMGWCREWPDSTEDPGSAGSASRVEPSTQLAQPDDGRITEAQASQRAAVQHPLAAAHVAAATSRSLAVGTRAGTASELRNRRPGSAALASVSSMTSDSSSGCSWASNGKLTSASGGSPAPQQHWLLLSFVDAGIEQEFKMYQASQQSKMDMMASALSLLIYSCAAFVPQLKLLDQAPKAYPIIFVPFLMILACMAVRMHWYLKLREPMIIFATLIIYAHLVFVAAPAIRLTVPPDRMHSVLWLARVSGSEGLLTTPPGLVVRFTRFLPMQLFAFALTMTLLHPSCAHCYASTPLPTCLPWAVLMHIVAGLVLPILAMQYLERRSRGMFLATRGRQVAPGGPALHPA